MKKVVFSFLFSVASLAFVPAVSAEQVSVADNDFGNNTVKLRSSDADKIVRNPSVKRRFVGLRGSVFSAFVSGEFNDPFFSDQWSWDPIDVAMPGSDIRRAVYSSEGEYTARVAILDGGFHANDDLPYADGYDLSNYQHGQGGEDYLTYDGCDNHAGGHGTSVAAIAAATQNNGIGIAGIAGNSEIVAVQVMEDCGYGNPEDIPLGILWAAGEQLEAPSKFGGEGVPAAPQTDRVDVINLSLLGRSSEYGKCPDDLQEAINIAHEKGVIIVAAAGNGIPDPDADSDNFRNIPQDAAWYAPANCEHVITVGASNWHAEKMDFSNYGEPVDLLAPGSFILAPGEFDGYYEWDGTSQAAPHVAGVVAMARSEYPHITSEEVKYFLKATAYPAISSTEDPFKSCDNNGCGAGVLDAKSFMEAIRSYMGSKEGAIKHALYDGGSCNENAALESFASSLCNMYHITFMENVGEVAGVTFSLYELDESDDFTSDNGRLVIETDKPQFIAQNIEIDDSKVYGSSICIDGNCGSDLIPMNMEKAAKPDTCR